MALLQYGPVSLPLGESRTGLRNSGVISPVLRRLQGHLFGPAGDALPNAAQDADKCKVI